MSYHWIDIPSTLLNEGMPLSSCVGKIFRNNILCLNNLNRSCWNFPVYNEYETTTDYVDRIKIPFILFPILDDYTKYICEVNIYAKSSTHDIQVYSITKNTQQFFTLISPDDAANYKMYTTSYEFDTGIEGTVIDGVNFNIIMINFACKGTGTLYINGIYVTIGEGNEI